MNSNTGSTYYCFGGRFAGVTGPRTGIAAFVFQKSKQCCENVLKVVSDSLGEQLNRKGIRVLTINVGRTGTRL